MLFSRAYTLRTGRLVGSDPPGTFEANIGETGRPALFALHGYTGTVSELLPLLRGVAAEGHAVRAPLLPGHGTRPHELQDVTFDQLLAFARAELQAFAAQHECVVLLGFSYGSLIATELAATSMTPLAGLAILGNAMWLPLYSRGPLSFFRRSRLPVPDAYLWKPVVADVADREAASRVTTYDLNPVRAGMEAYLAGHRTRGLLRDIHTPTLVLHGARDRICPAANAPRYARALASPDVTMRTYRRSAHLIAVDHDRDEVLSDVLAFLARV